MNRALDHTLILATIFLATYNQLVISLTYVLVLAASVWLFNESLNATKLSGTALVVLGLIVIARA